MDLNFYNFKKQMTLSTQVDLSIPGIQVKPTSLTTTQDISSNNDSGISDIDLGELKDERINFLYAADTSFINPYIDPPDPNYQFRLTGEEVTDLTDSNGDDLIQYPSDVSAPATLKIGSTPISIRPAHEYLKDIDSSTSILLDRASLSACGFWTNKNYDITKLQSGSDSRDSAWISIKDFNNKLNNLRKILIPKGIEILSTIYSKNLDINGIDINASGIKRSKSQNYSTTLINANNFINAVDADNVILHPDLTTIDPSEISPFDLSIKAVEGAINTDPQELFTDLIDIVNLIKQQYNEISSSVPILEGTPEIATNTTIILGSTASDKNNAYLSFTLNIYDINKYLVGSRNIIAYNGTTKVATIDTPWNIPLNLTHTFTIINPQTLIDLSNIPTGTNPGDAVNKILFDTINNPLTNNVRSLATAITYSQIDNPAISGYNEINITFSKFKQNLKELDDLLNKIQWFEYFQGISLNNSKISIFTGLLITNTFTINSEIIANTTTYKKLARILVPVDLGVKVKKIRKKKLFGVFPRYKYIRTDLGIRFVDIRFINTSILTKFRKNENFLLEDNIISATINTATLPASASTVDDFYTGYSIEIGGLNVNVTDLTVQTIIPKDLTIGQIRNIIGYDGSTQTVTVDSSWDKTPTFFNTFKILKSYESTNPDPIPSDITVSYDMPDLPFDAELRQLAFDQFGYFNNGANSGNENIVDTITKQTLVDFDNLLYIDNTGTHPFYPGYQIFNDTSKDISAMRGGLDIYKKAQFLVTILQDAFGANRVKLIETMRSFEDQDKIQFGGSSSSFLSWHNYGLAIKILITNETEITQIQDGSDDCFKLVDVAEAFINLCYNGTLGTPCNVVWCGQLKTGPDLFVWEFLPIGLNHKDSWKLRDSVYNQIEPVVNTAFVDVSNMIISKNATSRNPYIKEGASALSTAITIQNKIYVDPSAIVNYNIPSNLVLKDIQEFLFMINNKFTANGTTLTGSKSIIEWKMNNPISYNQLILYNSILGNYNIVRAFMAIDYVDRFESLINASNQSDPTEFVRSYLGDISYNNIRINISTSADNGYIGIDGKLYVKLTDVQSNQPEGNGNTFGQKQLDVGNVTIVDNGYIVSEGTVLTDEELRLIHIMISDQIQSEYKIIKDSIDTLQANFLYDSVQIGSNADLFNLLENEFGIISTQDIIPIDQIRGLFNRLTVNTNPSNTQNPDGTLRGVGINLEGGTGESVYEKLLSTLEDTGIQLVSPGKGSVIIEPLNDSPFETLIKAVIQKSQPTVQDLL